MTVHDEQHVQNLPFEIIAEAQSNHNNHTQNKNNPLNYKIRIKSKKERKMKQAIISVPKLNISQRSKNLRLVNSDQTIMSFDVFMDPHSDINPPKKREKFFFNIFKPGCLMQNDVDDVPYMPCASHNTNEMQNEYNDNLNDWTLDITEKIALRKNIIPASNTTKSPKTFFGQSKAGGCLDPPFCEDKYVYKPTSISPNTKHLSSDITKTSIENNKNKSDDSLLDLQIGKNIRDSVISDSLITYPQDLSTNETKKIEDNQNISIEQTSNSTRVLDNEFTELYYMPPKKTQLKRFEENPNKKSTNHKTLEMQDEIATSVVDIQLLHSSEIKIMKPELSYENILKDNKFDLQIIGEIATDDNTKSTNNKSKLYASLEQKEINSDYISNSDIKEIIDTIGITEGKELDPLSIPIKEPLDINKCNVENEKIPLRELQNGVSLNSSMDVSNKSRDLLARNLNLGYENDISTKKSEVDEARKTMPSTQSNIYVKQLSTSLGVFDNRSEVQLELSDDNGNTFNIENATSKIVPSPKEECLEKSNEEYMKPIQDKNIEYVNNKDEFVKKNKIEQSPKRSLHTLSNAEIVKDMKVAEKLSMISNNTQHSETPSTAFFKNIKNKQSITSKNGDNYDQNKEHTDGNSPEIDIYSHQFNSRTENDIIDISSTASLKIKQGTISELNASIKNVHSKISKSEEFKNEYSTLNKQKDKKETSAIEGDYDVQEFNTRMSTSKLSEDIFLEESYKSSNTKKSRSENLTLLSESIDENDKYYNMFNDDIYNKQNTTQQLKNTSRNSADLISDKSQHRKLRSSIKSESLTKTDFKEYETFVDLTKEDFNDLNFNKNTLHKYYLTNSSSTIKGNTSTSLHSIRVSKDELQKNVDAAHSNIFMSSQDTINKKRDKIKPEYLDSNSSSTEKFQNRQKNTDDFMAITNDITNNTTLLEKKNDVNYVELASNISNKDSFSKSIGLPSSIAINLNFHISNNKHDNIISIKTYDPILPPNKHLEDKFISTKCIVTETDKEIKIPITSDVDFMLSIKKKTRSRKIFNQTKDICKTISDGNIKYNSLLHDTINSVYNNLVPLKEIINDLRQEVKLLSQQQIQFIELLNKVETKPLRLIDIDQECKCQKRTLPNMFIHYG